MKLAQELLQINEKPLLAEAKEFEGRTADKLNIGDVVEISGNVQFKDSVGEIEKFGQDKKFVVVKLYQGGSHSFHSSDVTESEEDGREENEDSEEDTFYVAFYDEDEHHAWIGEISKADGGKWHESTYKGKADHRWGQSYMSYLTPQDIMSWIHKDYGRHIEIEGPFMDASEAEEHVKQNWGKLEEAQSLKNALLNSLSKVEPGSKLDKAIKHSNDMVRRGVPPTLTKAPEGYFIDKKGMIRLGQGVKEDSRVKGSFEHAYEYFRFNCTEKQLRDEDVAVAQYCRDNGLESDDDVGKVYDAIYKAKDDMGPEAVEEAAKWRAADLEDKVWTRDEETGERIPMGDNDGYPGDELTGRPGSWAAGKYKRMTKKGVPTQHELGMQNNTKMRMKMQAKNGGLTGPKGALPEGFDKNPDIIDTDFIRYDDYRINHLMKSSPGVEAIKAGKLVPALWQHSKFKDGPWIDGYATPEALAHGQTADGHKLRSKKKQGVEEGIGDTIKRGVKSVKRGMQGWGSPQDTPQEIVNRNKSYNDAELSTMRTVRTKTSPPEHSPAGLQRKVVDREMKKRGMQEGDFRIDNNPQSKTIDMTGAKCEKCSKGRYEETSQMDDQDGVLHCTKCKHEVKRHRVLGRDSNVNSWKVSEAQAFTDFADWKAAVLNSYPQQAKKMKFKGRMEGNKDTISAEVPGEDRSYGVWDQDEEKGVVLSEGTLDTSNRSPYKLNAAVKIKSGPADVVGKEGYIGEIRRAANGEATFTIDYDYDEKTGHSRSIMLKKANISLLRK